MLSNRLRALWAVPLLGFFVLNAGCSSDLGDSGDDTEDAISVADAKAALEISPLDIWAQSIPQDQLTLKVTHEGRTVPISGYPVSRFYLNQAGQYVVHVEAPMHDPADVTVQYDGSTDPSGMKIVTVPTGTGVSLGHTTRTEEGKSLTAHSLFVGVRHQWFSAQGRPARRGNAVKLMQDGEESWGTVRNDILAAQQEVHASTWWWESGAEMVRTLDAQATADQRWPYTVLGSLEASRANKRILVGQFWGQDSILSFLNTDSKLLAYASAGNDGFEFMGQANETRGSFQWAPQPFTFGDRVRSLRGEAKDEKFDAESPIQSTVPGHEVDLSANLPVLNDYADELLEGASYHQKFMAIDSHIGFVGGMNLRQNDWDSSQHKVHDARRMKNDASYDARVAVAAGQKATDDPPRKDYMVRIDGPTVQDLDDVFHERWDFLRKQGVKYAENASDFPVNRNQAAVGNTQIQVTATLPAPFNENAIAETWFNAVRNAKNYIYVEDQYFRVPMLDDVILQRMKEVPDLKLVVVTMDIGRTDMACAQSRIAYGRYKAAFPDRSFFLQLRAFDGAGDPAQAFVDMDTHSKMLIVDDVFMSVGSCNKNNRGIVYEGELNVALADEAFVTDARKRILANILGSSGDLPEDWIGALAAQAAANDQIYGQWTQNNGAASSLSPTGFTYSLSYPNLNDCILASVGPDRT